MSTQSKTLDSQKFLLNDGFENLLLQKKFLCPLHRKVLKYVCSCDEEDALLCDKCQTDDNCNQFNHTLDTHNLLTIKELLQNRISKDIFLSKDILQRKLGKYPEYWLHFAYQFEIENHFILMKLVLPTASDEVETLLRRLTQIDKMLLPPLKIDQIEQQFTKDAPKSVQIILDPSMRLEPDNSSADVNKENISPPANESQLKASKFMKTPTFGEDSINKFLIPQVLRTSNAETMTEAKQTSERETQTDKHRDLSLEVTTTTMAISPDKAKNAIKRTKTPKNSNSKAKEEDSLDHHNDSPSKNLRSKKSTPQKNQVSDSKEITPTISPSKSLLAKKIERARLNSTETDISNNLVVEDKKAKPKKVSPKHPDSPKILTIQSNKREINHEVKKKIKNLLNSQPNLVESFNSSKCTSAMATPVKAKPPRLGLTFYWNLEFNDEEIYGICSISTSLLAVATDKSISLLQVRLMEKKLVNRRPLATYDLDVVVYLTSFKVSHELQKGTDLESILLFCGYSDSTIKCWDITQYGQSTTFKDKNGHKGGKAITCIINLNDELIASSAEDHSIVIWNIATQQIMSRIETSHTRRINVLCLMPNAEKRKSRIQIFSGGMDGKIYSHMIKYKNGQVTKPMTKMFFTDEGPIHFLRVSQSFGNLLVVGGEKGVKVLDIEDSESVFHSSLVNNLNDIVVIEDPHQNTQNNHSSNKFFSAIGISAKNKLLCTFEYPEKSFQTHHCDDFEMEAVSLTRGPRVTKVNFFGGQSMLLCLSNKGHKATVNYYEVAI